MLLPTDFQNSTSWSQCCGVQTQFTVPASHMGAGLKLSCPISDPIPANASGTAAEDRLSPWSPVLPMGDVIEAPGSWLQLGSITAVAATYEDLFCH